VHHCHQRHDTCAHVPPDLVFLGVTLGEGGGHRGDGSTVRCTLEHTRTARAAPASYPAGEKNRRRPKRS
jgi:hypothetical protein